MVNVSLDGLSAEIERLNNIKKKIDIDVKAETRSIAYEILVEAKRLCPKKTGNLADSGYIAYGVDGWKVGFGASYAVYVHENMSMKHTNGQAKFLDTAVMNIARKRKLRAGG